ncbi:MAG: SEL1-like repeat protein [Sphingopyxis sp.]
MGTSLSAATKIFDANMAAASKGKAEAYFELGMAYSTGTDGVAVDMVEAHKWFNLAALAGVREGSLLRAEIASEMDREEIAEAQRQARSWIASLGAAATDVRRVA